jgi:hypothetical protein
MSGYQVALFIHILTFAAAAALSAVVHLAASRRRRARTAGEALEWQVLAGKTARLFPVALVIFTASGAYLIRAGSHSWSSGFVSAGMTAVILLLVIGGFLGAKGGATARMISDVVSKHGPGHPAPQIDDLLTRRLMNFNLGMVIGVAFDMATKPQASVAIGIMLAAGLVNAFATPSRVAATARAED